MLYGYEMPCNLTQPTTYNLTEEWGKFKVSYEKNYTTSEEEAWRKKIFHYTLTRIEENNARINAFKDGKSRGMMGITSTSDYTNEEHMMRHPRYVPMPANATLLGVPELEVILEEAREFARARGGGVVQANSHSGYAPPKRNYLRGGGVFRRTDTPPVFPAALDWHQNGLAPNVRDQGLCGGCWAFAATAVIEAHFFRIEHQTKKMSAQYLLDCTSSNNRCVSGTAMQAFEFIKTRGHVVEADSNQFRCQNPQSLACQQSTCSTSDSGSGKYIRPGPDFTPYWIAEDMDSVITALQLGPLVVHLDGSSEAFRSHTRGIFREDQCSRQNIGHTMVMVGYGSENGVDYWRIKNSWGTDWGVGGFIRLHRGEGINTCGVLSQIIGLRVNYFVY